MTAYNSMTAEYRERYREARMTHGQRQQAAQDWRESQAFIIGVIFAMVGVVAIIERMLGV